MNKYLLLKIKDIDKDSAIRMNVYQDEFEFEDFFTIEDEVELTESELIKLKTILRNEVAFHANMKGGKKFQVMFDKIRKVLDNE